jgi:hypothetical protein
MTNRQKTEKNRVIQTQFGVISKYVFWELIENLKLDGKNHIANDAEFLLQRWDNLGDFSIMAIEKMLENICLMYHNCIYCAARNFCRFRREGCVNEFKCRQCPRRDLCAQEGRLK